MLRYTDLEFPTEGQLSIIFQLNPSAELVCQNLKRRGEISAPEAFSDDSPVTL